MVFCRPGNRTSLPGLDGGGRSLAKPVSHLEFGSLARKTFPGISELFREFAGFQAFARFRRLHNPLTDRAKSNVPSKNSLSIGSGNIREWREIFRINHECCLW
jgi:hypothetical protein